MPQTPIGIGITHTDRIRPTKRAQGWASTTRPASGWFKPSCS